MADRKYSLVYYADYEKPHWRVRLFPKESEMQKNFMMHEVRGPFKVDNRLFPDLNEKGIYVYTNADQIHLNLPLAFMALQDGKETPVEGNILFLKGDDGKALGLTKQELSEIVSSCCLSTKQVELVCCFEELKDLFPDDMKRIETKKDKY